MELDTPASGYTSDQSILVNAGPLTAEFHPYSGSLRNISLGTVCVWRELLMLVRDKNWGTIAPKISHLRIEQDGECFEIHFDCLHQSAEVSFFWQGSISGQTSGRIEYRFAGEAQSEFLSNRIGFCLMHPAEIYAGRRLVQHRTDGLMLQTCFPTLIEAQVFGHFSIQNLKGMAHQVTEDVWGEAAFAGDVFETEDQRNWSDASFKTFSTPLVLPYPVRYQRGDQRQQSVILSLSSKHNQAIHRIGVEASPHLLSRKSQRARSPIPQFGLQWPHSHSVVSTSEREAWSQLIRSLNVGSLRVELPLHEQGAADQAERVRQSWKQALDIARAEEIRLEIVLRYPAGSDALSDEWRQQISESLDRVQRIVVFKQGRLTTPAPALEDVRRRFGRSPILIGGGSDAHFCELNRSCALRELPVISCDFLTWGINPQVHAFDDESILETHRSLAAQIETARSFALDRPLIAGPITFVPQDAAAASACDDDLRCETLVDKRQQGQLAAAWALAVWHELAAAGVQAATWFEGFGPRGIAAAECDREQGLSLFPVGKCFAGLAQLQAQGVEKLQSSTPYLSGVILHTAQKEYLSIVNLAKKPLSFHLDLDHGVARDQRELQPLEIQLLPLNRMNVKQV